MTCDAETLAALAKCYASLSSRELAQVKAYLLCQWANQSSPVDPDFYWEPASAVIQWKQGSGAVQTGNLAVFKATATLGLITHILANGCGVDAFFNIDTIPNTTIFFCNKNNLAALDVSGLASLTEFDCSENQISTLAVNATLTLCVSFDCNSNRLSSAQINSFISNLFDNGPFNGDFISNAQTPLAPADPGAVAALESNGWAVLTD